MKKIGFAVWVIAVSAISCGETSKKEPAGAASNSAVMATPAGQGKETEIQLKTPVAGIEALPESQEKLLKFDAKNPQDPGNYLPALESLPDTSFVRLSDYSGEFSFDLRYASENNFMKTRVYNCPKCYTRAITARALIAANTEFAKHGLRIRFFDCYRPNDVQYMMWKVVPNPQYVANPERGSIHNKGGAVDITLETLEGEPLDMGTDFDYFGKPAYHDATDLPAEVLAKRKLLKETMERHGFWSVRTEWWHYNLKSASAYPVANFKWPCSS